MSFTEITSQVEWKDVNWAKAEWTVFKLQKRIYRASQRGDVKLGKQTSEDGSQFSVCKAHRC